VCRIHTTHDTASFSSWWSTWGGPNHVEVINNIGEVYWEYRAPSWFHLQAHSQVASRATITVIRHRAIPFKAGVIISIYLPCLHFSKVVWDPAWYSFVHLVDVARTGVTCLVFHSQSAHCRLPVRLEQWLHKMNLPNFTRWTCPSGMVGHLRHYCPQLHRDSGRRLAFSMQQFVVVMHRWLHFLQTIPTQPHIVTKCHLFWSRSFQFQ